MPTTYEIMHKNRITAILDDAGRCEITDAPFLPYGLYLEETSGDFDMMVNNMLNFYAWCAGRMLLLDRRFAKELLNSIGIAQPITDREKAAIALSYHCLTLTDVYWVRQKGDTVSFEDVNLYENHLSNAFVPLSLRGRQMTVTNMELAPDLSTSGLFPKAWVRKSDGFWLYKDGDIMAVENELLASRIIRCFGLDQVLYQRETFEDLPVSESKLFTGLDFGICTWEHFQMYAVNHDTDPGARCLALDARNYYRMNIVDYLTGNTDRHWGNWGFLIDNNTNQPVRLHPLMDFNQTFHQYDDLDGARCMTTFSGNLSQREAAVLAVQEVGLGQLAEIDDSLFADRKSDLKIFRQRLDLLRGEL